MVWGQGISKLVEFFVEILFILVKVWYLEIRNLEFKFRKRVVCKKLFCYCLNVFFVYGIQLDFLVLKQKDKT